MKILQGDIKKGGAWLGQMSTYVNFMFDGKTYQTKTAKKGGKTPGWGTKFKFAFNEPSDELSLRVWKENLIDKADCIGYCVLKMSSLILNKGGEQWYSLILDNGDVGKVQIKSQFDPCMNINPAGGIVFD